MSRRPAVLFPFLFAIAPLLHLYVNNMAVRMFKAVMLPLGIALAATARRIDGGCLWKDNTSQFKLANGE